MKKSVSLIMLAVLAISSFSFIPNLARGDDSFTAEKTYVRMCGLIDHWGLNSTFGWMGAHAKMQNINGTLSSSAQVHAVWTTSPPKPHEGATNFTYSFYAAKLVNSSMIALNYSTYDFYISGFWDVYNITFVYYHRNEQGEFDGEDFNVTIEPVVSDATGELRVFGNWTKFEIDIAGIDLLSGEVLYYCIRHMEIEMGDVNGDGEVNIHDLVSVAHAYGSKPGIGGYGFDLDFNFDFNIDIGDLTTVAANIEE